MLTVQRPGALNASDWAGAPSEVKDQLTRTDVDDNQSQGPVVHLETFKAGLLGK
jgi:hypothetical protein